MGRWHDSQRHRPPTADADAGPKRQGLYTEMTIASIILFASALPAPDTFQYFWAKVERGEYQVIRNYAGAERIVYREPYDWGEAPAERFAIAEMWPSPDGRRLVILREIFNKWEPAPNFLRLVWVDTSTNQRLTMFGEEELPTLKAMLTKPFLRWTSRTDCTLGIKHANGVQRIIVNAEDQGGWDTSGHYVDWDAYFAAASTVASSARQVFSAPVPLIEKQQIPFTVEIANGLIEVLSSGEINWRFENKRSLLFLLPKDSMIYSIYWNGIGLLSITTRVAIRENRRGGFGGLSSFERDGMDYEWTSHLFSLPDGANVRTLHGACLVR